MDEKPEELKACPFCGFKTAELRDGDSGVYVECQTCQARTYAHSVSVAPRMVLRFYATTDWNTRAPAA